MERRGAAFQGDGDRPDTRALGPKGGHLLDQLVILFRWSSPHSPALGLGTCLATLVFEGGDSRQNPNHSVPHGAGAIQILFLKTTEGHPIAGETPKVLQGSDHAFPRQSVHRPEEQQIELSPRGRSEI
jgi:hypothetical protein